MYLQILFGVILIIILVLIVWIAYAYTTSYRQVLSITVPFEDTYRYVPNLNRNLRFKIDSIQVELTGPLKKDSLAAATITPGMQIHTLIHDNITNHYKNCLLIQEANTFIVDEALLEVETETETGTRSQTLRRCPIVKNPTVENLSAIFFNKLSPLLSNLKTRLISVKVISGNVEVTHSRSDL